MPSEVLILIIILLLLIYALFGFMAAGLTIQITRWRYRDRYYLVVFAVWPLSVIYGTIKGCIILTRKLSRIQNILRRKTKAVYWEYRAKKEEEPNDPKRIEEEGLTNETN